jgi:cysteinyl-tRNA synthetase
MMTFRLGEVALAPLRRGRIYVCGITPYDTTHIGHASTFVWTDTVARVMEHCGIDVEVCRNITDVDDDLVEEARRRDLGWQALATQQTFQFEDDMRKLRVRRPAFEPQSREYITDVVFMTRALLDRDAAYEREGSVYFRGSLVDRGDIGPDAALDLYRARGGKVDDPLKDDPFDSAVWQVSAEGEPSWPSPWGPGRPGWHIECAAMATSILGLAVDVHAGGEDLRFPHHAYESAMAEAATGVRPFARAWMHVGTVNYNGAKVAKSTGNLVFVMDLLQNWHPEAVRLLILDRDWQQGWDFSEAALDGAASRLERIWSAAARPGANEAASDAAMKSLVEGLDVSAALDTAEDAGGATARLVGQLLGLL